MFWVVDNFLMRKGKTKAKLEEEGGEDDSRSSNKVRYRRAASHEESESEVNDSIYVANNSAPGISAVVCHPNC